MGVIAYYLNANHVYDEIAVGRLGSVQLVDVIAGAVALRGTASLQRYENRSGYAAVRDRAHRSTTGRSTSTPPGRSRRATSLRLRRQPETSRHPHRRRLPGRQHQLRQRCSGPRGEHPRADRLPRGLRRGQAPPVGTAVRHARRPCRPPRDRIQWRVDPRAALALAHRRVPDRARSGGPLSPARRSSRPRSGVRQSRPGAARRRSRDRGIRVEVGLRQRARRGAIARTTATSSPRIRRPSTPMTAMATRAGSTCSCKAPTAGSRDGSRTDSWSARRKELDDPEEVTAAYRGAAQLDAGVAVPGHFIVVDRGALHLRQRPALHAGDRLRLRLHPEPLPAGLRPAPLGAHARVSPCRPAPHPADSTLPRAGVIRLSAACAFYVEESTCSASTTSSTTCSQRGLFDPLPHGVVLQSRHAPGGFSLTW